MKPPGRSATFRAIANGVGTTLLVVGIPAIILGPALILLHTLPASVRSALGRQPAVMNLVAGQTWIEADLLLTLVSAGIALAASLAWGLIAWRVFRPTIQRLEAEIPWTDD